MAYACFHKLSQEEAQLQSQEDALPASHRTHDLELQSFNLRASVTDGHSQILPLTCAGADGGLSIIEI